MRSSEDRPADTGEVHPLIGSAAKVSTLFSRVAGILAALIAFVVTFAVVSHSLGSYRGWGGLAFKLFMASGIAWIAYGFIRHWLAALIAITVMFLVGWLFH